MLIYLHATNQHPRSNHLGEMSQKLKKGIFTLSHPCVAVFRVSFLPSSSFILGRNHVLFAMSFFPLSGFSTRYSTPVDLKKIYFWEFICCSPWLPNWESRVSLTISPSELNHSFLQVCIIYNFLIPFQFGTNYKSNLVPQISRPGQVDGEVVNNMISFILLQ